MRVLGNFINALSILIAFVMLNLVIHPHLIELNWLTGFRKVGFAFEDWGRWGAEDVGAEQTTVFPAPLLFQPPASLARRLKAGNRS